MNTVHADTAYELPFSPGSVLATSHFMFTHYGIAGDKLVDGEQTVISCSRRRGGCREEQLRAFANEREVTCVGLIGNLTPHDILARARSQIGGKWDLFSNNCEHHVTTACGLDARSPQVRRALLTVGLAAVLLVPGARAAAVKAAASILSA
jgi:hypothetical protein